MKVRIKFAKYGSMKFIGHLDTMRFFQKAVRRADIDVKYSEGFSPHQIMSFAAPLGVGIESLGEYMDLEVNSMPAADEMKRALNRQMVEGMEVLSVTPLPEQTRNAMASVAAASYQIHKKEEPFVFNFSNLTETVKKFLMQEKILFCKETKKSVMEIDLRQGIYEMGVGETKVTKTGISAVGAALLSGEELFTVPCIFMTVDASSAGNIKPSMVFERLCAFANVDIPMSFCQVTKLETYQALSGAETEQRFAPLA